MRVTHSEASLPFSIVCQKSEGGKFYFMVNLGMVNDLIYNTYKRFSKTFDSNVITNGDYLSLDQSSNVRTNETFWSHPICNDKFINKLSEELEIAFDINDSCSVYLTIPKIPAGFDFVSNYDFIDKRTWWLNYRSEFLNQLKIVTSLDPDFQTDLIQNTEYIEKNNPFHQDGYITSNNEAEYKKKLSDSEYPGKFYIKLADITIDENVFTLDPFFTSNLVAPVRWVRLCAPQRLVKCYYEVCMQKQYLGAQESSDSLSFYTKAGSINHPRFLLKTIDEIKSDALEILSNFFKNYYDGFSSPKYSEVTVYRIFLIYKNHAGDKVFIEKIHEDINSYNELSQKINGDDSNFISSMTEDEAQGIFGFEISDGVITFINSN
jgi:hypothetical protein